MAEVEFSGNRNVNALLLGHAWDQPVLFFAFPTGPVNINYWPYDTINGFEPFSPGQQTAVINILYNISSFTNLQFTDFNPLPGLFPQDLVFGRANELDYGGRIDGDLAGLHRPGHGGAEAVPPDPNSNDAWNWGHVWLSNGYNDNPVVGGKTYQTLMHEIGHALGMAHGHSTEIVDHGDHRHNKPALGRSVDSNEYTVMTYRYYVGDDIFPRPTNTGREDLPQTYMQLDIAALQHMYGANFNHNNGQTHYRWDRTGELFVNGQGQGLGGNGKILMTIWDGGGEDTYDFSNFSNGVTVDLGPGGWTTIDKDLLANLSTDGGQNHFAVGNVANALLYNGDTRSLIENAIGGSGVDTLTGNVANNGLFGGADDDWLFGLEGNDFLDGGTGADAMYGGAGDDIYWVDNVDDGVSEAKGLGGFGHGDSGGNDWIFTTVSYSLPRWVENMSYFGAEPSELIGNGLANAIYGGIEDDAIYGEGGADQLFGGEGHDFFDGGAGADRMAGGGGDDTYVVDRFGTSIQNRDLVIEEANQGLDTVRSYVSSYELPLHTENLEVHATQDGTYVGGGNLENNIVEGILMPGVQASFRLFAGYGGSDTLIGNIYDDELSAIDVPGSISYGYPDILVGRAGNDTYRIDMNDQIVELADEGADTVYVHGAVGYVLPENVEDLYVYKVLMPGGAIAYGNSGDNVIAALRTRDPIYPLAFSLYGLGGDDTITGRSYADGADLLDGGDGDDVLNGLAGNDTLRGGEGADVMDGGAGNDTADYSLATSGVIVDFNLGRFGGEAVGDTFISIENINGSDHGDDLTGDDRANILRGGGGDDFIAGGAGADQLFGGDGNDHLSVDNRDTVIDGGAGDQDYAHADASTVSKGWTFNVAGTNIENVEGNAGNDTIDGTGVGYNLYIVGHDGNDGITGGNGDDSILGGNGNDTINGGEGFDQILGEAGNDILIGGGAASSPFGDRLFGGIGNDTLTGSGNGWLFGEEGNDTINAVAGDWAVGGAGRDTIIGAAGMQQIEGGADNDVLTGGADADLFDFQTGWGADRITDFELGIDTIRFQGVAGLGDFDQLSVTTVAGGTQIAFAGQSILLANLFVSADSLEANLMIV